MSEPNLELPDFDTLVELAAKDPDRLEHLRQSLIADVIEHAPEEQRRRLEGLQFVIDMERRRSRTPVQCCVKMSEMMYDRVNELRDTLNDRSLLKPKPPEPESNVVPLFPDQREDAPDQS